MAMEDKKNMKLNDEQIARVSGGYGGDIAGNKAKNGGGVYIGTGGGGAGAGIGSGGGGGGGGAGGGSGATISHETNTGISGHSGSNGQCGNV